MKTGECAAVCSSRGKGAEVVSFLSTSALVQHTNDASHSSMKSVQQCFFLLLCTVSVPVAGTCIQDDLVSSV